MFNTLEEEIEKKEGGAPSQGSLALRYIGVVALSAGVFGVLYMVISLVE